MKAISIWQPWTSLIVHRHKRFETRGFAPFVSIIGERIGIASTKGIKPAQRQACEVEGFKRHFAETGLPAVENLPQGSLLAIATLAACHRIDQAWLDELGAAMTPAEWHFGWYVAGRFAWELADIDPLPCPIPVRGAQGFWEIPDAVLEEAEAQDRAHEARA